MATEFAVNKKFTKVIIEGDAAKLIMDESTCVSVIKLLNCQSEKQTKLKC